MNQKFFKKMNSFAVNYKSIMLPVRSNDKEMLCGGNAK